MELAILAIAGDPVLQEEIRNCLELVEGCEIFPAFSKTEALEIVRTRQFNVVIIDAAENEIPLVRFAHELVAEQGNLRLLVIPPDNNLHHPVLKGLAYTSLIQRPLVLSEIRQGLGLDPAVPEELLFDAPHSADDSLPPPLPHDETGAETIGDAVLPDWLEEIGTDIELTDQGELTLSEPEISSLSQAWERENLELVETPPPLIGEEAFEPPADVIADSISEYEIFENPNTAVTTRLDPRIAEQALPAALDQSIDTGTESEFKSETPPEFDSVSESAVPVVQEPETSARQIEDYEPPVYPTEPEPGTIPQGIQGVKLKYSIVLIPRMPNHFLARELSERLGFILPQIHLTQGWRISGISIRPTYLLWHCNLPATLSPVDAVNQIKKRTSSHIFTNFPQLAAENSSGDFWSPGYLILSGELPPSTPTIREFIQRTRQTE